LRRPDGQTVDIEQKIRGVLCPGSVTRIKWALREDEHQEEEGL
jgi:hypothetical protein